MLFWPVWLLLICFLVLPLPRSYAIEGTGSESTGIFQPDPGGYYDNEEGTDLDYEAQYDSAGGYAQIPDEEAQSEPFSDEPDVKGSYRLNFGIEDNDLVWKDASYLLQEGSWRYLFGEKRHNTYDPAIYNQFKLSIDVPVDEKFSIYTKIVVDPWSFVGKSQKISLASWYGTTNADDSVDIQLKYWSNTGRVYPEIVRSEKGDSFALPEMKVVDGYARPESVLGEFGSWTHRIDIPALKIDKEFKPMRALWFDMKEDEYRMVLFLYAEENISMYSDDPLFLVNNHILWEPSPWLDKWQAGKLYTSTGWENGQWQRNLSLKDSEGNWLTLLRAMRLETEIAGIYTDVMAATPLDLWDDYDTVNNVPLAVRFKKDLTDSLMLGSVYSVRSGYDCGSLDAVDQAVGVDTALVLNEYHTLKMETAFSQAGRNLNSGVYKFHTNDYAYKALIASKMDPFELEMVSNISYTYMGRQFETPLSDYNYTKDDQPWGKHISFYSRSREEENYRIGNSITPNRKVFAFDINCGEFEGIRTYFNFRNVFDATDDNFLENIIRNETSYRINEQWLTKFLYLFHNRKKTADGKDEDTATLSGAFKYDFSETLSLEEIVEYTNSYPGFPDGLYTWLTINPAPPYPYYSLSKTRLIITPCSWTELILEHTYNEFGAAATLDDFMNYSGADIRFKFTDAFSARTAYRYSRVSDYHRNGKVIGRHNFYCTLAYEFKDESRFSLQFGELGNYIEGLGWQSAVLNTQHIIKILYEGKF